MQKVANASAFWPDINYTGTSYKFDTFNESNFNLEFNPKAVSKAIFWAEWFDKTFILLGLICIIWRGIEMNESVPTGTKDKKDMTKEEKE